MLTSHKVQHCVTHTENIMENTCIVYLDCFWYCGKSLPPECRDVERIEVFIVDIQLYYGLCEFRQTHKYSDVKAN